MHVDPIKPTLKPPGTERLKLIYYGPLSNLAFKFNLRRYSMGDLGLRCRDVRTREVGIQDIHSKAGAYTRSLFGST